MAGRLSERGAWGTSTRVHWCSTGMVMVVQNVGRIAVVGGRYKCERSGGWAGLGGRKGGKGSLYRGGACSFLKDTIVMEDMVIRTVGSDCLQVGFCSVRLSLVWLGILKHGTVSYPTVQ